MKNNRKNRKLAFIRQKNAFRSNKHIFASVFKFTPEFIDDCPNHEWLKILKNCVSETRKSLSKSLKITAKKDGISFGQDGLDFVNNTVSMKVTLIHH